MKAMILLIMLIGCSSCVERSVEVSNQIGRYQDYRSDYIATNFSKYYSLRQRAIDTLLFHKNDSLRYIGSIFYTDDSNWTVDSLPFFNTDSTRFYTKLLAAKSEQKNAELDRITDFGGALIGDRWYFFKMGTVTYVSRGDWHHDPYEPLTFEELSYLAWRRAIPGLIYRTEDGTIATRHESIDRMFFSTDPVYCRDSSRIRACKDSLYINNLGLLLGGKLTKNEILEIQQDIQNSKKPYVPPYKELTDEDRRRGKEEKLFDSKAWRDRYNYKSEEDEG